jgi:hypothetical protein
MDPPGHLLASRRHAEKAISSRGGNDLGVQDCLAQTEALLAVAITTGRLARARSAIQARLPAGGAGSRLPGRRDPHAVPQRLHALDRGSGCGAARRLPGPATTCPRSLIPSAGNPRPSAPGLTTWARPVHHSPTGPPPWRPPVLSHDRQAGRGR